MTQNQTVTKTETYSFWGTTVKVEQIVIGNGRDQNIVYSLDGQKPISGSLWFNDVKPFFKECVKKSALK